MWDLTRSPLPVPRRFKQQLQQVQQAVQPAGDGVLAAVAAARQGGPGDPPAEQQQQEQQYLRLPVESAKKLRWFDRQDINSE